MNNVTELAPARQSLIASMASQYQMEPKAFGDTVRATCMPATASNEEFAAFLMVAKQYGLNPITHISEDDLTSTKLPVAAIDKAVDEAVSVLLKAYAVKHE